MAKADIHHQDRRLQLQLSKQLPKFNGDREIVEEFLNKLQIEEQLSPARISKYLSTLSVLKRMLGGDLISADEKAIRGLVAKIEKVDKSEWTKHSYRVVLKRFLRYLGKEPDWLKTGNGKRREVLPEEILSEQDVEAMATAAYTTRDKSFILSLYESGCRIGEFLPLRLKHVSFDKHGALLRVTGKTGPRRIRLVFSVQALQRWIDDHPGKGDPDAFLWCKIPSPNNPKWVNSHLSYGFISRLLRELATKAGVKRAVNAHAFRHARATFMARHLKEPEMREFFGWGRDSEMPSIYVHLSGRDVDDSVLSIYGIKEASKSQEPTLKTSGCPRCQEPNNPGALFCHKCGLPLKEAGGYKVDKIEDIVVELLKAVAEINPNVKDRFREIVKEQGAEELFS